MKTDDWRPDPSWTDQVRVKDFPAAPEPVLYDQKLTGALVGHIVAVAFVGLALPALAEGGLVDPAGAWLVLILYLAVVVPMSVRRLRSIDDAEFRQSSMDFEAGTVVHGKPGSIADAEGVDAERAAIGAIGERRTAMILDQLAAVDVDGLHIMHGLKVPFMGNADMDHVLLYAGSVLLLDSKMYAADRYRLGFMPEGQEQKHLDGRLCIIRQSDGHRIPSIMQEVARRSYFSRKNMEHAWVKALNPRLCEAAIVVHGEGVEVEHDSVGGVRLVRPEDLIEKVVLPWMRHAATQADSLRGARPHHRMVAVGRARIVEL